MSSEFGAIATPHAEATDIGAAILDSGGNAIDAAVAAAIALCVVYPNNVALGSDLVAVVRDPAGNVTEINATGWAGSGKSLEQLRDEHGGSLPMYGVDTINVPGALRGLEALMNMGARLPWKNLVSASVKLAREGIPMPSSVAKGINILDETLRADPGCAAAFFEDGAPIEEGSLFRQPALADTLEAIANNGADEFYSGEVGRTWLAGLQAMGSGITADDLMNYRPEMKPPLNTEFDGYKIYSSGPNTQGFALLRALNGVSGAQPNAIRELDRALLAQQFLATNAVRDQYLGDPKFGAIDGEALMQVPVPISVTSEYKGRPMGDTVGISVASADGYAVSLIQSVYFQFGAAVLEPNTGILFQNRATSFSLESSAVNSYAPGKRPSHTLMPVLVTENDQLKYVLASMGGQGQPQIHAQIFASMIEGDDPLQAVHRARWLVGRQTPDDEATTVTVELGTDPQLVERFKEAGLQLKHIGELSDVVGHANIIAIEGAGKYEAASDPRSDGSARIV